MIPARYIPNLITGLRFVLVVPFIGLLIETRFGAALGVFAVMGLSDAVDGFLAKRYRWNTTLGQYLDPLADKVMLVSAYLALGWLALLPAWLVALVILRDVVIVIGALAYQHFTHRLEMRPSPMSKANTCLQLGLALVVIFDQLLPIPELLIEAVLVLTALTTLSSGLGYVVIWGRRSRELLSQ